MEDLLQFTNEDISGGILDENLDDVFSAEFTQGLTELRLDSQVSLCVPNDDLSEFDWLSSFDLKASSGAASSPNPGIAIPQLGGSESCGYSDPQRPESKCCPGDPYRCFDSLSRSPTSVLDPNNFKQSEESSCHGSFPARPRSKRSRGISRAWSSNLLSELNHAMPAPPALHPEHSSGNDACSELASSDFSPCNSLSESGDSTAFNPDLLASAADSAGRKLLSVKFSGLKASSASKSAKKMRKKRLNENPLVRRCNHCSTTKTPQWRAGPDGPKTLCNACGVRYKSGRLLPEYRPAGSPGYVFSKHSNSHRKILEMRRLQEMKLAEERRNGSCSSADRAAATHSSPSVPPPPVSAAGADVDMAMTNPGCDVNMTEPTN